jgi:hypothetical protein
MAPPPAPQGSGGRLGSGSLSRELNIGLVTFLPFDFISEFVFDSGLD